MRFAKSQPIRILQVAGSLLGGVGVWLRAALHHLDRQRFHIDFLVYHPYPQSLDDEVYALGAEVIRVPLPHRFPAFAYRLRRAMRDHGPYDIVHSHLHRFNGLVLRMARNAGVPKRIAHSHLEIRSAVRSGLLRHLYEGLMNRWLNLYATGGLAASQAAAADLFGPDWQADRRWQVLHCGIDLTPFHGEVDPAAVRREFGIPPDAWVVGHVGTMWEQKNHPFLVQVAAEITRRAPGMRLLLVGDGPLRAAVERQVEESGLEGKVIFAGMRSDVPRLMRGAMQVFLFPSLYEGLGLVLVEAQASGLPCVISDTIPAEADVVKPLMRRLSLAQPPEVWAETVLAARNTRPEITPAAALAQVEASPFNIVQSARELQQYYESAADL